MAYVLIIEDELVLAHQLAVTLEGAGHEVLVAGTAKDGLELAAAEPPDLVLLDLRLPDASGLEVISTLRSFDSAIQIVLMTAFGSERDALESVRRGASGYLTKPLDVGEMSLLIERLGRERNRERELLHLREQARGGDGSVLAASEGLQPLFGEIERLCDPAASPGQRPPLVLVGERGSGRRAMARALHERFGRGPFLEVEAHTEPGRLEESLFGAEARPGMRTASLTSLLEAAEGGTLAIHDADALPATLRERLVEATKTRRIRRVNGRRDRPIRVHLVLTLSDAAGAGTADDLIGALRALAFRIPPLCERPQDIVALARHFAAEVGTHLRGGPRRLRAEAEELLARTTRHLTELHNVVERAVIQHEDEVLGADAFQASEPGPAGAPGGFVLPPEGLVLEEVERDLLRQALERTGGNQSRAARLLGVSRDTLRYRIGKLLTADEPETR